MIAAVSPVPETFRYVVAVLTKAIIHQSGIKAVFIPGIQALAIITRSVPIRAFVVAAVASVPEACGHIIHIMTIVVFDQIRFGAGRIGIQAITIVAVLVPAGVVIVAAVSPIPITFLYVAHIMTDPVTNHGCVGAFTCRKS